VRLRGLGGRGVRLAESLARSAKRKHSWAAKAGASPGTLVHIGEQKTDAVRISIIDYDENNFLEKDVASIEDCFSFRDTATVTWINIDGVHDPKIVERLGAHFGLHPLIQEDIMNTTQRPKLEDMNESLYVLARMLEFDPATNEVGTDQLSLVVGRNFVISFQERPGDEFGPVRDRIRRGKGRIRKSGPDYLAYALLDAMVDHYFIILERLGERVELLEDELVSDPRKETLHVIHTLKREMIFLRKSVWPLREVVSGLERSESDLIQQSTAVFLRDLYEHTVQVIDNVETLRDMLSGMLETYLSSISNRMNEVMKVLTIISTIFIPLTFIAGVYGMNFEHMPELKWRFGYFAILGFMIAVGLALAAFFKRKKWL
jgi:magnesium transporter